MANSKRRCVFCKSYQDADTMVIVPAGAFCNMDCALSYSRKKDTVKRKRQNKKELQTFQNNDRPKQLKLTQAVFNKMRVQEELLWFEERGLVPKCISCGKPIGGDIWCCGHFRTRGASSSLRFDRRNTYLQHNYNCNMKLSGDISGTSKTHGYKVGLVNRFGREAGQAIIDYCESQNAPHTFECSDLIEMRKDFSLKFRELQIARRAV